MGLQEEPQTPCGIYIGEVQKREDGYRKVFNQNIGRECHNSPYMQRARMQHREKEDAFRRKMIEEKKRKMAELQSEIDELEQ